MAEDDVKVTIGTATMEMAKWKDRFFLLLALNIFQILERLYELVGTDNHKLFGVGAAFLGLGVLSSVGLCYLYNGKIRHVIVTGNIFLILFGLVWWFIQK